VLLSDSLDDIQDRHTAPEQVRSGLIIYAAVERRLILATVLIVAGADTTASVDPTDPAEMCRSDAPEPQLLRL